MYEVWIRYPAGWSRGGWFGSYAAAEACRQRWQRRGWFAIVEG